MGSTKVLVPPGCTTVKLRVVISGTNIAGTVIDHDLTVDVPKPTNPVATVNRSSGTVDLSASVQSGVDAEYSLDGGKTWTFKSNSSGNWSATAQLTHSGDTEILIRAVYGNYKSESVSVTVSMPMDENHVVDAAFELDGNGKIKLEGTVSPVPAYRNRAIEYSFDE